MVHPLFFYTLSGIAVAGALGVVLLRNPVYAVLSLVVALFGLSALFVALEAYFVAVIQILVYAGAVLVLFLFVVMLLDMVPEAVLRTRSRTLTLLGGAAALFLLIRIVQAARSQEFARPAAEAPAAGTTAEVGRLLFTTYALPFEAASLLLVVGIIGAIVLAKRKL